LADQFFTTKTGGLCVSRGLDPCQTRVLAQLEQTQALPWAGSGIFANNSGEKVASMHQHLEGEAFSVFSLAMTHMLGF
jgi:hypothetical protein